MWWVGALPIIIIAGKRYISISIIEKAGYLFFKNILLFLSLDYFKKNNMLKSQIIGGQFLKYNKGYAILAT